MLINLPPKIIVAPQYSTIPGPYDPVTGKLKPVPPGPQVTDKNQYDSMTGGLQPQYIQVYKDALKKKGVTLLNMPISPIYLKDTYDVFNTITPKRSVDLKIHFRDKYEPANNSLLNDPAAATIPDIDDITKQKIDHSKPYNLSGGEYVAADRRIEITTTPDRDIYKFRLAHELGHYYGIGPGKDNENLADAFAWKFFPGWYSYLNNPYIKFSWQKGYVPPNPIPTPIFPDY